MQYFTDVYAWGGTGTQSITTGFQPVGIRVTVSKKFGALDNVAHISTGSADGFAQAFDSFYWDASGGRTFNGNNKIISHYERAGVTLVEVISADFVGFTATGVDINIIIANSNYNVHVEVWG